VGCVLLAAIQPSFAQKLLTTEPLILDPYAVVYVNDGSCSAGKILKVMGVIRGLHRKSPAYLRAKFLGPKKPSIGTKMNSASKRMASETLARMLAVTAMLVIGGFIFYSR
jgi:hypothetical protein